MILWGLLSGKTLMPWSIRMSRRAAWGTVEERWDPPLSRAEWKRRGYSAVKVEVTVIKAKPKPRKAARGDPT